MGAAKNLPPVTPPPPRRPRPHVAVAESSAMMTENFLFNQIVNRDDIFFAALLILPSLIVFALMAATGVSLTDPTSEALVKWGANYGPLTLNREYWRWITSTFLHIGAIHIAMNTAALFRIAPLVNAILGSRRTAILYLCSGIAGSLCTTLFAPNSISAGASGAIMGLFGVFFPVVLMNPAYRRMSFGALGSIGFFVVMVIANGFTHPNIGNAAHLGGFIFGLVTGLIVASQDGSVPENFVIIVTIALCALTASISKRDVNPYQLAIEFDNQFRPGKDAITRISSELRAGHPATKAMLNDLENAALLVNGNPEKAQALYDQARSTETKATVAKVMTAIITNRIYLTGMIAQLRYDVELNPESLKTISADPAGYGTVYGRIAANLGQLKQADLTIHSDLETIRRLSEDNKIDANQALSATGGTDFLKKFISMQADLRKFSVQLMVDIDANARRHFADISGRAQQAPALPVDQLQALAKGADQGVQMLKAVFQQTDHDLELKQAIAGDQAALEAAKRAHIVYRSLSYYQPYLTMLAFWKEHSGLAVKPEDTIYFRDNVMDRYAVLRTLFNDPDAQDPVSMATMVAAVTTNTIANCVQTVMATGSVPAWDAAHPGSCTPPGGAPVAAREIASAATPPAENLMYLSLLTGAQANSFRDSIRNGKYTDLTNLTAEEKKQFVEGKLGAGYVFVDRNDGKANNVIVEINGRAVGSIVQNDANSRPTFAYLPGQTNTVSIKVIKVGEGESTVQKFKSPTERSSGAREK